MTVRVHTLNPKPCHVLLLNLAGAVLTALRLDESLIRPYSLPLVSREWKNGSNSSYNGTPFLHSLLTQCSIRTPKPEQLNLPARSSEHPPQKI